MQLTEREPLGLRTDQMADRNHFSGSERGCELRIPKDTPL
jgi:hypothetical protein